MSDVAIKVEGISKSYLIGHQSEERYIALRDVVANKARNLGKRLLHPFKSSERGLITAAQTEEFWALKDVSFEVKSGDRIGIIGRNGAGKSTLLKVLSRITEPTSGRIEISGRVASLLEVGTGFHPELTGRENIFLNGAILGMSRWEIKKKFDEIVDFAEINKFLDTPVKRYSSGMYVRLAFAVAAHLEPDILIVDEVLAVGDTQFQKKCLGKMEEVGKEGRTVLFVSHNMTAIERLCPNAIFLEEGRLESHGQVRIQINRYLNASRASIQVDLKDPIQIDQSFEIRRFEFSPNPLESGQSTEFHLELRAFQVCRIEAIAILIYSSLNVRVGIIDIRIGRSFELEGSRSLSVSGIVRELPLVEGEYNLGLYLKYHGNEKNLLNIITLFISTKSSDKKLVPYSSSARGLIELNSTFTYRYIAESTC